MGSTRLPGKVLRQLAGRSVLSWVVRAARDSGELDGLVVATTLEATDDLVVAECARLGVDVHRGPTDDVLTRFLGALDRFPADALVRLTADCPLLDPVIVSSVVRVGRVVPGVDYVSTAMPRCLPRGLDVEFVTADALRLADRAADRHHRVHVTSYLYSHPGVARLLGLTFHPDRSGYRLTLDTPEDWAVISALVESMGDGPHRLDEVVAWLDANPGIRELNAAIEQKGLADG